MQTDLTANLDAACAALTAVLRPHYGPCEAVPGTSDEGEEFISFLTIERRPFDPIICVASLAPSEDGGYVVHEGDDADEVWSAGQTPAAALWEAVETVKAFEID